MLLLAALAADCELGALQRALPRPCHAGVAQGS
jgi:hypothetical protein